MRTRTLQQLLAHFARLDADTSRQRTDDELRSLRHYRAEVAQQSGVVAAEPVTDRAWTWVRTVRQLEDFIAEHHRFPKENNRRPAASIDPVEQRLVDWVRYQRRPATVTSHCAYQLERLALVSGYARNPLDGRWLTHFSNYRAFLTIHGAAPVQRSSDGHERALAARAAKQRLRYKRGRLPADRILALNALPIWGRMQLPL